MEVAIGKESPQGFRAKAIDAAPGTSAAAIAEFVCRELAGDPTGIEPEVSLVDGKRLVARPLAQPVESLTAERSAARCDVRGDRRRLAG